MGQLRHYPLCRSLGRSFQPVSIAVTEEEIPVVTQYVLAQGHVWLRGQVSHKEFEMEAGELSAQEFGAFMSKLTGSAVTVST